MASLLGSMAGALGKGLQQTTMINEENNRRQQDRNFQIDMEDRRAKRQERLAKMQMKHSSKLQEDQRQWEAEQADKEFGRKKGLLGQRLAAEREVSSAEANREEITRRAEQLNKRASKYDEVLLKHMDPETGMIGDPESVSSWQEADLKNLDYLDRVLSNYDEATLKAAGRWQDYQIVKETIAQIEAREAELAAEQARKEAEEQARREEQARLRGDRGDDARRDQWLTNFREANKAYEEITGDVKHGFK